MIDVLLADDPRFANPKWRIDKEMRLTYDVDLIIAGRFYEMSLHYPNCFPFAPPLVIPRGDWKRWSSHQYEQGELCLEVGADNWLPSFTGAEMLRSAAKLLEYEAQGEAPESIPTREFLTSGQQMRNRTLRFIKTASSEDFFAGIMPGEVVVGKTLAKLSENHVTYLFSEASERDWKNTQLPKPLERDFRSHTAIVIGWAHGSALPDTSDAVAFRSAVGGIVDITENPDVIIKAGKEVRFFKLWTDGSIGEAHQVDAAKPFDRLGEDHRLLLSKKVAVVGCGSLGSKVAASLARSGVATFLLVDDDILLPENMVRHDLDWRNVGSHKSTAVAEKIALINPDAAVLGSRARLAGQESSTTVAAVVDRLADCDLIIDATANSDVFNFLASVIDFAKKGLIWGEVYPGGIGGLVARHRPLQDPEPLQMRAQIDEFCRQNADGEGWAASGYGLNRDGIVFTADDADVSVIAAHVSRLALDFLIRPNESDYATSAFLIGLRKGWIFTAPFDVIPLEVGAPQAMHVEAEGHSDAEQLAFVGTLFRERPQ